MSSKQRLLVNQTKVRRQKPYLCTILAKFISHPKHWAKKSPGTGVWAFRFSAWQFPTFAWQTATLSSALSGFTSEFGMGSGGSRSLWSPSKLVMKAGSWVKTQGDSWSLAFRPDGCLCSVYSLAFLCFRPEAKAFNSFQVRPAWGFHLAPLALRLFWKSVILFSYILRFSAVR